MDLVVVLVVGWLAGWWFVVASSSMEAVIVTIVCQLITASKVTFKGANLFHSRETSRGSSDLR